MFTLPVRIAALSFTFLAGVFSFTSGKDFAGVAFLVLELVLILDYFRSGTVWVAFRYIRKGEIEKAAQQIEHIKYYNKLRKAHKASYHIVKGYIALHNTLFDEALFQFREALEIGPKHPKDRMLCYLNLTSIYLRQKKITDAKETLANAKKIKLKGFEEELKRFSKKLYR